MTPAPPKLCFVISPIGEESSETRRKADEVLNYLISPVVGELGYETIRADKIDESGTITTQIIQKLVSADLVVADLSERNPNVFYELSVRHASRKPFIQLITAGEPIPFDVAANRTIQYDLTKLSVVEAAKLQLRRQIQSIETNGSDVENPITTAIDLNSLNKSSISSDRTLGDIISTLTDIGLKVAKIDQQLNSKQISQTERLRQNLVNLRTKIAENNSEIGRLRAIKGQIDYESLASATDLEPVLYSFANTLEHIRDHCVPHWPQSDIDRFFDPLSEIIESMKTLALDSEIPF